MPDTYLFTPYVAPGRFLRAYMQISREDMARFDALPPGPAQTVRIFDEISYQFHTVRRAACGCSCYCAAEILNVDAAFAHKGGQ